MFVRQVSEKLLNAAGLEAVVWLEVFAHTPQRKAATKL
jgi:hypothetical protein